MEIYPDLHQFSLYLEDVDVTVQQYLLLGDTHTVLFGTGMYQQAQKILPLIQKVLGARPLDYIFVSHLESDEAGGLPIFHKIWPEMTVICSQVTARELPFWNYAGAVFPFSGGESAGSSETHLDFIDYPSEVHLQNGLLCYEQKRGILYSSDIFFSFGDSRGKVRHVRWADALAALDEHYIPNAEKLAVFKKDLSLLQPAFVATGHGVCLEIEEELDADYEPASTDNDSDSSLTGSGNTKRFRKEEE